MNSVQVKSAGLADITLVYLFVLVMMVVWLVYQAICHAPALIGLAIGGVMLKHGAAPFLALAVATGICLAGLGIKRWYEKLQQERALKEYEMCYVLD